MWKWLQTLFERSPDDATLRDDVADEVRRKRRDGSDGAALLMMMPAVGSEGSDGDASGGGAGASDGGGCGASCGSA